MPLAWTKAPGSRREPARDEPAQSPRAASMVKAGPAAGGVSETLSTMARRKTRELVRKRECRGCPALCCKGLVMPIEKPKNRAEIEELEWHVQYRTVRAFIRSHRWYLLVEGDCMYLDENNLCRIYERRPQKCREHNPPECERFGPFYDEMLSTPEQVEHYFKRERERLRRRRRKSRV